MTIGPHIADWSVGLRFGLGFRVFGLRQCRLHFVDLLALFRAFYFSCLRLAFDRRRPWLDCFGRLFTCGHRDCCRCSQRRIWIFCIRRGNFGRGWIPLWQDPYNRAGQGDHANRGRQSQPKFRKLRSSCVARRESGWRCVIGKIPSRRGRGRFASQRHSQIDIACGFRRIRADNAAWSFPHGRQRKNVAAIHQVGQERALLQTGVQGDGQVAC